MRLFVMVILLTNKVVSLLCDFLLDQSYTIERPHAVDYNGYVYTAYFWVGVKTEVTAADLNNVILAWFKAKQYTCFNLTVIKGNHYTYSIDSGETTVPKKSSYDLLSNGGLKLE